MVEGGERLRKKVYRYRPRILAVLGVGTYRVAFNQSKAVVGRQQETIGNTMLWVLPNPSGLNANYQMKDLTELFVTLREEAEK
jgi:double-stranded uracil-DNA glycosylase